MTSESIETAAECELVSLRADEYADGVLTVELDRPDQRNALNEQLRRELKTTLEAIERRTVSKVSFSRAPKRPEPSPLAGTSKKSVNGRCSNNARR